MKQLRIMRLGIGVSLALGTARGQPPPSPVAATWAQTEQLFLDGKITARDYQRFLDSQREQSIAAALAEVAASRSNGLPSPRAGATNRVAGADSIKPELGSIPATAPSRAKLDAIDARLTAIEVQREAREKASASATNRALPPTAIVHGKRQQLDELLRLFAVEGKISEAEYKERRLKIMALPD